MSGGCEKIKKKKKPVRSPSIFCRTGICRGLLASLLPIWNDIICHFYPNLLFNLTYTVLPIVLSLVSLINFFPFLVCSIWLLRSLPNFSVVLFINYAFLFFFSFKLIKLGFPKIKAFLFFLLCSHLYTLIC